MERRRSPKKIAAKTKVQTMTKSYKPSEKQLELPVRKEQYRSTLSVSETETHEIVLKKITAEKTCRTSQTSLTSFYEKIEQIEYTLIHETAGQIAEPETNNQKRRHNQGITELTCKETLAALLRQEKTPEKIAERLNCSTRLVYRAMKKLHIPTARAYVPEHLEHNLNLKKNEDERKK